MRTGLMQASDMFWATILHPVGRTDSDSHAELNYWTGVTARRDWYNRRPTALSVVNRFIFLFKISRKGPTGH